MLHYLDLYILISQYFHESDQSQCHLDQLYHHSQTKDKLECVTVTGGHYLRVEMGAILAHGHRVRVESRDRRQ